MGAREEDDAADLASDFEVVDAERTLGKGHTEVEHKDEKPRKRDRLRALFGHSKDSDDHDESERSDQEEEEEDLYPQPEEQILRRFPKPVHLDTTADTVDLRAAVETHLAGLEGDTTSMLHEALACLVSCYS